VLAAGKHGRAEESGAGALPFDADETLPARQAGAGGNGDVVEGGVAAEPRPEAGQMHRLVALLLQPRPDDAGAGGKIELGRRVPLVGNFGRTEAGVDEASRGIFADADDIALEDRRGLVDCSDV